MIFISVLCLLVCLFFLKISVIGFLLIPRPFRTPSFVFVSVKCDPFLSNSTSPKIWDTEKHYENTSRHRDEFIDGGHGEDYKMQPRVGELAVN